MFFSRPITTFTGSYSSQLERLKKAFKSADAIVIGAGAGMSVSAGMTYTGDRFERHFADFHKKYGITDMYAGGFYPYDSPEEYWAWWSRHIYLNRYDQPALNLYLELLDFLQGRDYFVLTTNVDHQFQLAGFDKKRLFYTQGDYGLWQCSDACHKKTYDNEETVRRMVFQQKNMRVPSELVPHCPRCGKPMAMNLRCDSTFVQDEGFSAANRRYKDFLRRHEGRHVLFLELGVGGNTPGIIKFPFWQMTAQNPDAVYACINDGDAMCPEEIRRQSICLNSDIKKVLSDLRKMDG